MTIRSLKASDEAAWRPLWRGYLDFYNATLDEATTVETFRRLLDDERYFALVCEERGALAGLVHCVLHASTWSQRSYCYLADLYVAPVARGRGVARSLIEAVCAEAKTRACARVHWLTHEGNDVARRLYDKLASFDGFVQYRRKL